VQTHVLAAAGSTGNNTHAGVFIGGTYDALAVAMEVTAVGATPTVTWKAQGSLDGTNWFDLGYITDASDTVSVATRVMTAVGEQVSFLSNPVARKYNYIRLVTSANTNVTYKADLFTF
jgi:hypothetical protein